MDANPLAFLAHLGTSKYVSTSVLGGCSQLLTEAGVSPFNSVFDVTWGSGDVELWAREVMELHRSKGLPAIWWLGPSSSPPDLIPRLELLGLQRNPSSWLMRAELTHEPSVTTTAQIACVRTPSELKQWNSVIAVTHDTSPVAAEASYMVYSSLPYGGQGPLVHFLAREGDMPLATATAFFHDDYVGIYNVATIREARGRGLATAVTSAALALAHRQGFRRAMLGSEAAALNIYRRLGFEGCGELVRMLCPPLTTGR